MPPRNLLTARAMTENCEPSVLGPRPPGPSPPFRPRPRVSPPAARVASSPFPREGDPASAPFLQVAQPDPAPVAGRGPLRGIPRRRRSPSQARSRLLPLAPRPGGAPSPAPAGPVAASCPPRGHPRPRYPTPGRHPRRCAPAPPARADPQHKDPGGAPGGGGVDAPAAPPTPRGSAARCGRGRAHLPPGRGTVHRQSCSGRAGRQARTAAPSFRTTRAAAPARGRDRTAGGAHAPAGLAPSACSPAPPAVRPRVRPPRAAAAGRGRSRESSALPSQPRAGVPRARR